MKEEINFSKCRHFDTPGCLNQDLEIVKGAAETLAIPDAKGGDTQYIDTLDIVGLNKICAGCEKYERKQRSHQLPQETEKSARASAIR